MILDSSGNRRFYGVYRGTVTSSEDPDNKRRIKATVPQVLGTEPTDWAWPVDSSTAYPGPPKVGQGVWVMFEGGDPSFPIWSGTFGLYKGSGSQVEITDLPNSSYPETISDNVSEGKFDVISSVVDMANNIQSLVLEADFPGGGLEGQILAKLSDDDFDTIWLDNYAQELRIIVKNDSGVTINKGQAVMAVGSVGDRIRVAKANADGSISARFMLGVASENITNGNEGYINLLGAITKLNTSAYTVGTVLYIDPATPGALTSTEPTSPQLDMSVAIVTRQHATTGIIFVRMWNQGVDLGEVNDVKITTPADGQVLTYDSSTNIWVNEAIPPIPQAVPAGVISQFAGASAPSGYLLCDGSAVSRTTYSNLFAALDITYGAGNGTTTFNLPNLQNRIPVGKGADVAFDVLGETGGSKTVTLSEANMAAHTHSGSTGVQSADHSHNGSTGIQSANHVHNGTTGTVSADHSHDFSTGGANVDHSHSISFAASHNHTVDAVNSRTAVNRATGTLLTYSSGAPASRTTSDNGGHSHGGATGGHSVDHSHGGTTGGINTNHSHDFTTGGISANHAHSFTTAGVNTNHSHSFTTNSGTGTATPITTLPPYIVVNYIIKT